MKYIIKLIEIFLGKIILKLSGGLWGIKSKINNLSPGYKRRLFISIYENNLEKKGSFIGHSAKFSGTPVFPHGILGVFISGGATVGKNCVIFHQVTIGSNTIADSKGKGAPTIGDNCYIGAGAKIIGNIKVGNNCRIGANCIVAADVPDNSLVVLNSPKVIFKENMNNKYYTKNMNGEWQYYDNGKWIIDNSFK